MKSALTWSRRVTQATEDPRDLQPQRPRPAHAPVFEQDVAALAERLEEALSPRTNDARVIKDVRTLTRETETYPTTSKGGIICAGDMRVTNEDASVTRHVAGLRQAFQDVVFLVPDVEGRLGSLENINDALGH
jgi:hypothetical protein